VGFKTGEGGVSCLRGKEIKLIRESDILAEKTEGTLPKSLMEEARRGGGEKTTFKKGNRVGDNWLGKRVEKKKGRKEALGAAATRRKSCT